MPGSWDILLEEEYVGAFGINVSDTATQTESIFVVVNPLILIISDADAYTENVSISQSVLLLSVSDANSIEDFVLVTLVMYVAITVNDVSSLSEFVQVVRHEVLLLNVNDTLTIVDHVDGVWTSFVLSWNDIETFLSTFSLSWNVVSDSLSGANAAILNLSWQVMDVLNPLLMSWRVIPIQIQGLNSDIQLPVFFVSFNTRQINVSDNESMIDSVTILGLPIAIIINDANNTQELVVISIPRMISVVDTQSIIEDIRIKYSLVVGDVLVYDESITVTIV